jgi:hypothetical protein
MRRKAHNRLWTIILTLLLCGASAVSMPRVVRAEISPGETGPPPPPDPQAGDPDWPTGGARAPKPGSTRGGIQPGARSDAAAARQDRFSVWMFKVRMAFAAAFRVFFRF